MQKFQVFEDDGGEIILFVFDEDGNVEYAHTGYEYDERRLLDDLRCLRDGVLPVSRREEDFEDEKGAKMSAQEYYDYLMDLYEPDTRVICDNDGLYYVRMGLSGMQEFFDSPKAVAAMIRSSDTWFDELNRQLCKFAGLEKEYDEADSDSFESVVYKAAEKLKVEII